MALFHVFHIFSYDKVQKLLFLRIYVWLDPKYTLDVCHSLKVYHRLNLKNAEYEEFLTFKTTFCKNF